MTFTCRRLHLAVASPITNVPVYTASFKNRPLFFPRTVVMSPVMVPTMNSATRLTELSLIGT